jgi:formylmethanofuran dehydrogenase subunit E
MIRPGNDRKGQMIVRGKDRRDNDRSGSDRPDEDRPDNDRPANDRPKMLIDTSDPVLEAFLVQLDALHKHLCPRQVIGVRMGMHAAALFSLELPQRGKRLLTFVETDGCFADGIGVATGCSMGHRTMRLVDHGKIAATFVDTHTGKALRCRVSPDARVNAAACVPEAKSRWHAQLAAYQRMATEELFQVQDVVLSIDIEAIVAKPGLRTACSVCGEEIVNQRQIMVDGQPTCRSCAGDKYWIPSK